MKQASGRSASSKAAVPIRRAVIDVGTNSVKLLVGDVSAEEVTPVLEDSTQTRLGRGFYENHVLQRPAIRETADAVASFAAEAKQLDAKSIRVFATSAARDARNAADLVGAIEKASGLRLEIISGEQEAELAFRGVVSNPQLAKHPLLILDVGGGSTEFIVGEHGHAQFQESFNIGTVRLLEKLPHSEPPKAQELDDCRTWLHHFLDECVVPKVRPALRACSERRVQLIGTGGTSTIIARIQLAIDSYDRDPIEAARISRAQVHRLVERLWSLPLAQRQEIIGLPKKRADVILPGVAIYEAVMDVLGFPELRVSTRGLRYAALMGG